VIHGIKTTDPARLIEERIPKTMAVFIGWSFAGLVLKFWFAQQFLRAKNDRRFRFCERGFRRSLQVFEQFQPTFAVVRRLLLVSVNSDSLRMCNYHTHGMRIPSTNKVVARV